MIQILTTPAEESHRPFLNVKNLIRASYILLAFLLVLAVFFSSQFRAAARWRMSPEYLALAERDKHLAEIRKYISQGVTSTRDHLVNNHANSDELYQQELRRAKSNNTKAFLALTSWTAQQSVLSQMDGDLAEFWTMLDQSHLDSVKQKSEQGYDFLHTQLIPLSSDIFYTLRLLSDEVAQQRATMARHFAEERSLDLTYIFADMGVIIVICLLLASGNQRFRHNSQKECRQKLEEVARARDSLEQLSGRLLRIQEDERRKISRELHDGIGQLLTALRMEIHQVQFAAAGGFTGGEERLVRARKLAEEAVQTVKNISLLLRPPLLDDLGLEPALAWLTEQFGRRTGISCRFHASNLQERLPDDIKTCVFRVIQEAINNCEKHASPTEVEISVEQTADAITVCVEDDGAGFALNDNNTPARQAGLGILGMRERAVLLGGTLIIRSSPGRGTKLKIELPVASVGIKLNLPAAPAPVKAPAAPMQPAQFTS